MRAYLRECRCSPPKATLEVSIQAWIVTFPQLHKMASEPLHGFLHLYTLTSPPRAARAHWLVGRCGKLSLAPPFLPRITVSKLSCNDPRQVLATKLGKTASVHDLPGGRQSYQYHTSQITLLMPMKRKVFREDFQIEQKRKLYKLKTLLMARKKNHFEGLVK